jgi:hypothetical protein
MTVSILVDKVGAAPVWTGRQTRGMFSSLFGGKTTARPLGGRSGVAFGTPVTTGSVAGTAWTIRPHAGAADLEAATESIYPYVNDADVTGSHNAAHATLPRVDIVCFHLDDPAAGDGTSVPVGSFVYTVGLAAAVPVAPATPARSMPVLQINVPANGTGASTATWIAPYLRSGGSTFVRNVAERADLVAAFPATTENPVEVWRKDAGTGLERESTIDNVNWRVVLSDVIGTTWTAFASSVSGITLGTGYTIVTASGAIRDGVANLTFLLTKSSGMVTGETMITLPIGWRPLVADNFSGFMGYWTTEVPLGVFTSTAGDVSAGKVTAGAANQVRVHLTFVVA